MQSQECPKSFITGESIVLLEEFFAGMRLGFTATAEMPARKADAFVILRDLMEREVKNGTSQH